MTTLQEFYSEEIADRESLVNAYFAAFREEELRAAREEELRAAEDCIDAAELERQVRDTLKRLSAASPIATTQDRDRF